MTTVKADARLEHPAHGEMIELVLDGDTTEGHPLGMLDGKYNGWKHNGPLVRGRQILLAKWVELGSMPSFEEILVALAAHGRIPEGQWLGAVSRMFREDGQFDRAVADSSWYRDGQPFFPVIRSDGLLLLRSTTEDFCEHSRRGAYLWLVGVEEAQGN